MPTSSLIFDYDYSDILAPSHTNFSSDSFTRLKTWKYDEWATFPAATRDNDLANTEKVSIYLIAAPSGGLAQEVEGTAYLCVPFVGGSHLGINSGVYNSFPNEPNYVGAHFPITYMNQLILDMQDKYLEMDSDVRTNSFNPMVSNLPTISIYAPLGYTVAPTAFSGQVETPSVPVYTSMKILDLSDNSNSDYQWGNQFLALNSGTPVESGAGPINRMLKRVINPLPFVKNMAVNCDVRNGISNFNSPSLATMYPQGQVDGGLIQKVRLNFGTTYPTDISLVLTSNRGSPLQYHVYERDSGNSIDYGHEREIGTIDMTSSYVAAISYGSSGLAVDSNGVFFPVNFNKDWTYNTGDIGTISKNYAINMTDQIFRTSAGVPSGDTWSTFLYRNFNANNQLFEFTFQNYFWGKPVSLSNYDTPLIPKLSNTPSHANTHTSTISLNSNTIPFVNSSADFGSGLTLQVAATGLAETWVIREAFVSGNVSYDIAAFYTKSISNQYITDSEPTIATGYGGFINYNFHVFYQQPFITLYCKDINNNKHTIMFGSATTGNPIVDYDGASTFSLDNDISLALPIKATDITDTFADATTGKPSNISFVGLESPITDSGSNPSTLINSYNYHFTRTIGGLFDGIHDPVGSDGAFKSIQNIGYKSYLTCIKSTHASYPSQTHTPASLSYLHPGINHFTRVDTSAYAFIYGGGGASLDSFTKIGAFPTDKGFIAYGLAGRASGTDFSSISPYTYTDLRYSHKSNIESAISYTINDAFIIMDIERWESGVLKESARSTTPITITSPTQFNSNNDPIEDNDMGLDPTNVLGAWWL